MHKLLWLLPALVLTACAGTPAPAGPAPDTNKPTAPQPYENGVISVPVSPVQALPEEW